ncbi:unnamed protein product, partial [Sphagnum balticum]
MSEKTCLLSNLTKIKILGGENVQARVTKLRAMVIAHIVDNIPMQKRRAKTRTRAKTKTRTRAKTSRKTKVPKRA